MAFGKDAYANLIRDACSALETKFTQQLHEERYRRQHEFNTLQQELERLRQEVRAKSKSARVPARLEQSATTNIGEFKQSAGLDNSVMERSVSKSTTAESPLATDPWMGWLDSHPFRDGARVKAEEMMKTTEEDLEKTGRRLKRFLCDNTQGSSEVWETKNEVGFDVTLPVNSEVDPKLVKVPSQTKTEDVSTSCKVERPKVDPKLVKVPSQTKAEDDSTSCKVERPKALQKATVPVRAVEQTEGFRMGMERATVPPLPIRKASENAPKPGRGIRISGRRADGDASKASTPMSERREWTVGSTFATPTATPTTADKPMPRFVYNSVEGIGPLGEMTPQIMRELLAMRSLKWASRTDNQPTVAEAVG